MPAQPFGGQTRHNKRQGSPGETIGILQHGTSCAPTQQLGGHARGFHQTCSKNPSPLRGALRERRAKKEFRI